MSESEEVSKLRISLLGGFTRIITGVEEFVEPSKLQWNKDEELEDEWLTLEEIATQLKAMGHANPYYVWHDTPLAGWIFLYGNYSPEVWERYGTTKGFA